MAAAAAGSSSKHSGDYMLNVAERDWSALAATIAELVAVEYDQQGLAELESVVTAADQAVDQSDAVHSAAAAAADGPPMAAPDVPAMQVPPMKSASPVPEFSENATATTTASAAVVAADAMSAETAGTINDSTRGEFAAVSSAMAPARVAVHRPDLGPNPLNPAGEACAGGIIKPTTLPSMRSWMERGPAIAGQVAASARAGVLGMLCCGSAGVRRLLDVDGWPSAIAGC